MFQFPGFASLPLCIQGEDTFTHNVKRETAPNELETIPNTTLQKVGFPIRKSVNRRLFAPPHGLSQRTTSFIASYCQGIHQMPLGHLIALINNVHPISP